MKGHLFKAIVYCFLLIPVGIAGYVIQMNHFEQLYEGFNILDFIMYLPLNSLFLGIGIVSLVRVAKGQSNLYYFPLVLCIGIFFKEQTIHLFWKMREASPIILEANFEGEVLKTTLFLRENKTYKLKDEAVYTGAKSYFGEYTFNGDTLKLSRFHDLGEDYTVNCNKLLLKDRQLVPIGLSNGEYKADTLVFLKIK